MTQPLTPQAGTVERMISELYARVAELERANPLINAHVPNGGTLALGTGAVIKSDNFDGDLSVPSVGTQGWALGGPSNVAALATLLLRPGSVGNDALTSPVAFDSNHNVANSVAYTTTAFTHSASTTLVVPAGFTKALVMMGVSIVGLNPSGAYDNLISSIALYSGVTVIGAAPAIPIGVAAGITVGNTQNYNIATAVTAGATLTVYAEGWTQVAGWPASANNFAAVNVAVLYGR